jgi:sec-independent protein translocase protein TatB
MFNLGWGEILLIGIVALIAIGPKELPGVLRTVGQLIGKVRRMANEFQGQFQEALREADIADIKKQAEDLVSDVGKYDPLTETQKDLEKSLDFSETAGAPTTSAADYKPDAPAELAAGGVTDGAKLPEGVLPSIDIPLPELPAPLTEKDFLIAAEPPATPAPDGEPGKLAETPAAKQGGSQA